MEKEISQLNGKEKEQSFINEYNEICNKYGLQLIVQPVWIPTNHNTYEMSFKLAVGKIIND